jgi:hypothetical protein
VPHKFYFIFILFYFCNEPIGLANHSKKWNFLSCPKEKVLFWSVEFLPFGPGERRITFAKAYGIKSEVVLGTPWETCQELGNSLLCVHVSENRVIVSKIFFYLVVNVPRSISNFILFFCVSKWQRINASYSIMHHVISSTKILWYICIV